MRWRVPSTYAASRSLKCRASRCPSRTHGGNDPDAGANRATACASATKCAALRNHQPVLAARHQLQRAQGATNQKSELAAASRARPVNNAALERLVSVSERVQARPVSRRWKKHRPKEAYRRKATNPVAAKKWSLRRRRWKKRWNMKRRNWRPKLAAEAIERDPWARRGESARCQTGRTGGVNARKEESDNVVCLHLRSTAAFEQISGAQQKLAALVP